MNFAGADSKPCDNFKTDWERWASCGRSEPQQLYVKQPRSRCGAEARSLEKHTCYYSGVEHPQLGLPMPKFKETKAQAVENSTRGRAGK